MTDINFKRKSVRKACRILAKTVFYLDTVIRVIFNVIPMSMIN